MTELEYKFTHDTLFKMVFVQHQDLLKRLVAELLGIRRESIGEFVITNPEMPPEVMGEKFCRLDINMSATEQCRVARKERRNPLRKRDVLSNGCEFRPAKTKLSQPVASLASVPAMARTMRSQANT